MNMMLGAFSLVSSLWLGKMYNEAAQVVEFVKWLFVTGQKFESYDFTPSEFSFENTGVVYRVRFRPQHALPHMVCATFPKNEHFRWERAERVANGFSARLFVRHGQTMQEVPRYRSGMPVVLMDFLPDGIMYRVEYMLFVFHAGNFDWRYDDEIELTLETLSPVVQESYLRLVKPKLSVAELPYFQ